MDTLQSRLDELRQLVGQEGEDSRRQFEEALCWLRANAATAERKAVVKEFVEAGLDEQIADLSRIRDQIEGQYHLLPISYIAKNYFGKSTAWLTQRINGNPVRGKVYTLNAEQKAVFNAAVQDIAKKISSVSIR